MNSYVLDSFAVVAHLDNEPGHDRVDELLEGAQNGELSLYICVVNLGEILYMVERERGLLAAQWTLAGIRQLPIEVVDADLPLTLAAAHIKANHPMSYADCFAAALAQSRDARVVTGDPEFEKVASFIPIEWIARRS